MRFLSLARITTLLLTFVISVGAAEHLSLYDEKPAAPRIWKASLISLVVAQAVDAQSSWGKCESNSFLAGSGGRFDSRSLSIKSGMIAGLALAETISGRHHPKLYGLFSAVNFSVGAGIGGMALHNYTISAPAPGYSCK